MLDRSVRQADGAKIPGAFTPLKVSVSWLLGTYLGFLGVGEVQKVDNPFQLTAFVSATIFFFIVGYWLRILRYRGMLSPTLHTAEPPKSRTKILIALSAAYYAGYGLIYMREYGVASVGALTSSLTDPGSAYLAKFDVYTEQQASGGTNLAGQLITLVAVLSAPLVPFLIVSWKRVTWDLRLFSVLGLSLYGAFFLAIGTLSGLATVFIYGAVATLVIRARGTRMGRRRRGLAVVIVIAGLAFTGYMSYNQGARVTAISLEYRYDPNPLVERFTNEEFARGLTVTTFYPTHGYQGLAYNLGTPFEWTKGRGSSRALDGYLSQYGLGKSVVGETYPGRTEDRTGWPAGRRWATIYPWLASDLTWPGAALFMGFIGWWTARLWYESVVHGSRLALLLLCQVAVVIAFVPANNQVAIGRPSLICLTTLIGAYAISRLNSATKRNAQRSSRSKEMVAASTIR